MWPLWETEPLRLKGGEKCIQPYRQLYSNCDQPKDNFKRVKFDKTVCLLWATLEFEGSPALAAWQRALGPVAYQNPSAEDFGDDLLPPHHITDIQILSLL